MLKAIKKVVFTVYRFVNSPFIFLLNRKKIVGNNNEVSVTSKGLKHLILGKNIKIPEFCFFGGSIKIGDYTTLGIHNYFIGDIEIGKFCQIGAYVAIHSTNHPISHPTTYINKNFLNGEMQQFKSSKKVIIGNDVWIGHGSIILQGVKVGDGAIIAAGSLVTKDIEPYSIVAGNPAKLIRKRFSDNVIRQFLVLKWWDQSLDFIEKNKIFFFTDLKDESNIEHLLKTKFS